MRLRSDSSPKNVCRTIHAGAADPGELHGEMRDLAQTRLSDAVILHDPYGRSLQVRDRRAKESIWRSNDMRERTGA
jgi:hypothetical protein